MGDLHGSTDKPVSVGQGMNSFVKGIFSSSRSWKPAASSTSLLLAAPLLLVFVVSLNLMVPMLFDMGTTGGNLMPALHNLRVHPGGGNTEAWGQNRQLRGHVFVDLVVGQHELSRVRFEIINAPGEEQIILGFAACSDLGFKPGNPCTAGDMRYILGKDGIFFPSSFSFAGLRLEDSVQADEGLDSILCSPGMSHSIPAKSVSFSEPATVSSCVADVRLPPAF